MLWTDSTQQKKSHTLLEFSKCLLVIKWLEGVAEADLCRCRVFSGFLGLSPWDGGLCGGSLMGCDLMRGLGKQDWTEWEVDWGTLEAFRETEARGWAFLSLHPSVTGYRCPWGEEVTIGGTDPFGRGDVQGETQLWAIGSLCSWQLWEGDRSWVGHTTASTSSTMKTQGTNPSSSQDSEYWPWSQRALGLNPRSTAYPDR